MPQPPTFRKVESRRQPIFFIVLTSKTRCRSHHGRPICRNTLGAPDFDLDGVAQVQVIGATKYAVRIQADPDALAARGIGIDTLANAVSNRQRQPGDRRAERPNDASAIIHTDGQLNNADAIPRPDHRLQQRRAGAAGRCRHCDSTALENAPRRHWYQDQRASSVLAISRQPGSNTIAVVDNIKAVLPQFQAMPAAGHQAGSLPRPQRNIRASSTMCRTRC